MRVLETGLAVSDDEYPFRLRTVQDPEDIDYAIVSHTWGEDELLYEDVMRKTGETRAGFVKVLGALHQARKDGYDYLWMDNVCIDKSSSTELQEALNSMFAWYHHSSICYGYLCDVRGCNTTLSDVQFAGSRWFTRGWTLQELIAPKRIDFFNADWVLLGDKVSLLDSLCKLTRISREILTGQDDVDNASIAQRMSWAAHRRTTRGEDRAYSLMGLFRVNMPMLYGEGTANAFLRLQEEIMRRSDDHTIFAWRDENCSESEPHGLLSDSPDYFDFKEASSIRHNRRRSDRPYAMTNRGLDITLTLHPVSGERDNLFFARINCTSSRQMGTFGIYLLKPEAAVNTFARVRCSELPITTEREPELARSQAIYVPQGPRARSAMTLYQGDRFLFLGESIDIHESGFKLGAVSRLKSGDALQLRQLLRDLPMDGSLLAERMFRVVVWPGEQSLSFAFRKKLATWDVVNICLGVFADGDIGFDLGDHVASLPMLSRGRDNKYKLKELGTTVRYRRYDVTINAETFVENGIMVFAVAIHVADAPRLVEESEQQVLTSFTDVPPLQEESEQQVLTSSFSRPSSSKTLPDVEIVPAKSSSRLERMRLRIFGK